MTKATSFLAGVLMMLAGALTARAAAPASLPVARDGQPRAAIIHPTGRSWATQSRLVLTEQHAALTLQANLLQMTGAALPLVPDGKLGELRLEAGRLVTGDPQLDAMDTLIFVGLGPQTSAFFEKQAGKPLSADLVPGGMRIVTIGNALLLIGHPEISHPLEDGGGVRRAVAHLLESLGFRMLWPGETGKVVPHASTLSLQPMDVIWNPVIRQRVFRWSVASSRAQQGIVALGLDGEAWKQALSQSYRTRAADLVPRDMFNYQASADFTWTQWQGLGGSVGIAGGHAFGDAWKKWGAEHPDWFALQADGTRDQSAAGSRSRLCVSNLGLIQAIADEIIADADANPNRKSHSLSPNDGGYSSFCLCDQCKALDDPSAPKVSLLVFEKVGKSARKAVEHPALTDRFVWFWNHIAQRVAEKHPDLLLVVDAYSYYSDPPMREKLHPSLVLRYVPADETRWEGWKRMGARRMYWRPNIFHRGSKQGELCIYAQPMARTIRSLTADGMFAMDMDSILGYWATSGLNYYVAARLVVNPALTYDAVVDDFCRMGFGPAAPAVRDYFDDAQAMYLANEPNVLSLETLAKLREHLRRADALAGQDAAILQRIAFLRLGLNMSELHETLDRMAQAAQAKQPVDKARAARLFDLYHLACRDVALHHPQAINIGHLMVYSGQFAGWRPLDVTTRKPSKQTLARIASGDVRMTGREDGIEGMLRLFGPAMDGKAGPSAPDAPAKTTMEADEQGRVYELPAAR